jgi:hypothetical protein
MKILLDKGWIAITDFMYVKKTIRKPYFMSIKLLTIDDQEALRNDKQTIGLI